MVFDHVWQLQCYMFCRRSPITRVKAVNHWKYEIWSRLGQSFGYEIIDPVYFEFAHTTTHAAATAAIKPTQRYNVNFQPPVTRLIEKKNYCYCCVFIWSFCTLSLSLLCFPLLFPGLIHPEKNIFLKHQKRIQNKLDHLNYLFFWPLFAFHCRRTKKKKTIFGIKKIPQFGNRQHIRNFIVIHPTHIGDSEANK